MIEIFVLVMFENFDPHHHNHNQRYHTPYTVIVTVIIAIIIKTIVIVTVNIISSITTYETKEKHIAMIEIFVLVMFRNFDPHDHNHNQR